MYIYIYVIWLYIYDIYIYACMKWCSHRYTKLCIHMPASTCKQESSMVYGVARKFFATQEGPSGPWRGRRFFISKQSTLDQDRSLPWPPWSHMKFHKKKTLRRWKEEVCDSVWPKQLTSRPFILAVLPFVLSSCIGRTILAAWTAWTELEPQTLSLRKSKILWVQLLDTDVIQTFPTWKLLWR